MSTSNQTHNHKTIQEWADERGGVPAKIKGTEKYGDQGVLRIHFPEHSDSKDLAEITWDEFFTDFEKDNLDFLYQDKKSDGETSTFHKLVSRDS
ncbi:1,4-alpha-glucan branching enzyme [Pedobacter lusitanus]|uniref:Contig7, whole genome shotgun sequence n=1 Tax=Pedobacter lusitanus TaxID=1503925 RepID=A0A0D0FA74_9SPHI|nr:hypothetical protein [Pedobacter lusitanus]KIO78693.1 1,4-alpha-glucan branching enzyme [Pedobacter lusitanus]